MAARMGTIEIELDEQSRDVLERFTDSVDRFVRTIKEDVIDAFESATGETTVDLTVDTERWEAAMTASDPWAPAPPPAQIIEWPLKTRPPRMIVVCPVCSQNVDGEPLSWEIVLNPIPSLRTMHVRGLFQHTHDDQTDVRWPFAVEWSEPEPVIDAYVADERDDDVDEGQQKNEAGDPWEFTPDHDGTLTTSSAIFQALGGASTCWENPGGAGEFDSTRAREIGDALLMLVEARLAHESDEITRLDQIIYRARASLRSFRDEDGQVVEYAPRVLDNVATILAAVDGPDSPRAKRLRGEA